MKNRLLKVVSLIICFTIVLLTFINCGNSNNDDKQPAVETDYLIVTYNGYGEEKHKWGLHSDEIDAYKFKLRLQNKSEKKVQYKVTKMIIDGETFDLTGIYNGGQGGIDANEKTGDQIFVSKEKLSDAGIEIDEIKTIELFMNVADEKYDLIFPKDDYPFFESPKIVFEF